MTRSRFIVIEHDANKARLHWDLRFKMPKSSNWASFALRKGIPTQPGKKVLAVRTHDHSTVEALFIGTIKKGYGAGKLKKWDGGNCIIHKYSPSHMAIEFKGQKVKGIYHLINTGVMDKDYKRQTYLLFKGKIVSEAMGMISMIPRRGLVVDLEKSEDELYSAKLPWSKAKGKQIKEIESVVKGVIGTEEDEEDEVEEAHIDINKKLPWSMRRSNVT
jgi:DNA ligase D-like protein (predicted 3'-phosphoesterase)